MPWGTQKKLASTKNHGPNIPKLDCDAKNKYGSIWIPSCQNTQWASKNKATSTLPARPSLAHPEFHSLARPHSLVHPVSKMSLTCTPSPFILEIVTALSSLFAVGCCGVGWDNNAHVPVHTHRHRNLIIFPAPVQTQALLFHDQLPVGWGGTITFMFLCTHRHRNLIIFLAVLQTQALLFHDQLPVGWSGTITFFCPRADTGAALS